MDDTIDKRKPKKQKLTAKERKIRRELFKEVQLLIRPHSVMNHSQKMMARFVPKPAMVIKAYDSNNTKVGVDKGAEGKK